MTTIYLVQCEEVDNLEKVMEVEKAFKEKEDAQKFFNQLVNEIKEDNNFDEWEVDEYEGEWCAYPDGEYLDRHFLVTWKAIPLH